MRQICGARVSGCLLAICFWYSVPCVGAGIPTMKTIVLSEGSVPPAFVESFVCIHDLDDKPFSDPLIQNCVAQLRANYFIRDVKVRSKEMDEGRWASVEFVLTSEPLKVDEFAIRTFDAQEPNIWKILSKSDDNLHVGGIYSWPAEAAAYNAITFFYRAQGKMVGVVPEVKLDYKQGKAWVNFRVVQGPAILKQPSTPPYGEWCDDRITYVDWSSSDDGIPVDLIESGLTLASPFTCFSNELAERDKAHLSNLSFLSSSSVEYSGAFGNRHIQYKLKAKPLTVEQINLRSFGDASTYLEDRNSSLLKNLSLKTGEPFSRSAASRTAEYLQRRFSPKGYWSVVTVQEEVSGTQGLSVTFSVLVFPLQTIIVDGQVLQSPTKLANDATKAR
jgi:hypothetical protein